MVMPAARAAMHNTASFRIKCFNLVEYFFIWEAFFPNLSGADTPAYKSTKSPAEYAPILSQKRKKSNKNKNIAY